MNLISQIESILFVASKPLEAKQIAKATKKNVAEVEEALETLKMKYNHEDQGIHILCEADQFRMSTNPVNVEVVDLFIKDEASGDLTKAQLETLTVIAYRDPVTKPELEQIRGVNCTLILRNLLLRGLIEQNESQDKILPVYNLSVEALRHLGVDSASQLPDYETLHSHEFVEKALEGLEKNN